MVKSSAIKLIREMREQDILSIVTFSDRADVLVPAGMVRDPKSIEMKIQMLNTSGGTEIYQGLEKGFVEINSCRSENRINHMILLTDGRTYGDEQDCLLLAQQAAEQGVSISGLGIGSKWNDDFLDGLTAITGGNSLYVSKPTEILYFLSEKFSGLKDAFAQKVTFVFNLHKGVELQYAYRLQPDAAPLLIVSPMMLGSIQEKSSQKILFEFLIHDLRDTVGDMELLDGTISLDIPTNNQSRENYIVSFNLPTSIEYNTEYPHSYIVDAMSKLTLYRMQEQARKEIAEGTTGSAAKRLQSMATQLINLGETDLARVVLEEVQNIQQKDGLTEEGGKRIKYGTRNLLLPEIPEDRL
jgi:Ca-activated chloride channel family protein